MLRLHLLCSCSSLGLSAIYRQAVELESSWLLLSPAGSAGSAGSAPVNNGGNTLTIQVQHSNQITSCMRENSDFT